MREIKFRGVSKAAQIWVDGYLVRNFCFEPQGCMRDCVICWDNDYCEVIPETVGQFTGLKDKNGVEIYEGDVVRAVGGEYSQGYYERDVLGVMKWQTCGFDLVDIKDNSGCGLGFADGFEGFTILGNIHENPELLNATSVKGDVGSA